MKIINKYLIRKFVGPFILTFFFALIILLMQYLWLYVDELVGKGLEIYIILELLVYAASATMVQMAAPLAVLLSSLMTFGTMGEHYELVALKSAGVPISKLMIPLATFCLLIGIGTFWFSNEVSPKAWLKMKSLMFNIKEQKPALSIEEGTFYDGFDNYFIRVGKKHRDNETIEDVLIYDDSQRQGNTTMTYAKKGRMKITPDGRYMLFILYDGFFWDESNNGSVESGKYPLTRAKFKEQYKRFDLSSFQIQDQENDFYSSSTKAMSIGELEEKIDTLKGQIAGIAVNAAQNFYGSLFFFSQLNQKDSAVVVDTVCCMYDIIAEQDVSKQEEIYNLAMQSSYTIGNTVRYSYDEVKYKNESLWGHQIEWHRKFTLSVACVLFFFVGASLGSIIRKGGIGIPLLVTVIFFTLYFAMSVFGEKIAKGSTFPVGLGMWLSTLALIPICVFLTIKATTDSSVLSAEEYRKWVAKIKLFLFKKTK